jgi:hypothetical protein
VSDRSRKQSSTLFASGQNVIGRDASDSTFFAETLDRPKWDAHGDPLLSPIERLVLIHRLMEVVPQVGFMSFEPPAPEIEGELDMKVERQMLDTEIKWLSAIEHRGEGIFIQLRASAIDACKKRPGTRDRSGGQPSIGRSLKSAAGGQIGNTGCLRSAICATRWSDGGG